MPLEPHSVLKMVDLSRSESFRTGDKINPTLAYVNIYRILVVQGNVRILCQKEALLEFTKYIYSYKKSR